MRRASASGFVVLALVATGCGTTLQYGGPGADKTISKQLADLGVEGRTYMHDLGALSSIYLHAVHFDGGDLLVEDIHGHLTYVDGATLNARWEYYGLPETFTHAPSFTPSGVIGLSGGKLFVLTRDAGVPSPAPRTIDVIPSAAPVANESTFYVPTFPTPVGNKTVYAVSLGSGYVGWGHRTSTDVMADLAKGGPGGGDTVYFASTDGQIFAYPTYGATERAPEPAWTAHANAGVRFNLVVEGDDLGVVTADGRLICYDRITGNVRWEAYPESGQRTESSASFSSGMAFYRRGGKLYGFDRATGASAWTLAGGRSFLAERDGNMLFSADGGVVVSVDAKTGKVQSRQSMKGVRILSNTAANGTVYAVTDRGMLVAVEYGY